MALVLEDGTGKADANSYGSVAEADSYHATYTGSTVWANAETADKERALIVATQYLDIVYGDRCRGLKGSQSQALEWPRVDAEDNDGYLYDSDEVPTRWKQACFELALRHVSGDELLAAETTPGRVAEESFQIGPLKEATKYEGARPYGYVYPKVEALVRELIARSDRVIRG